MTITKGQVYRYNSAGYSDGKTFLVTRTGDKKTVLQPVRRSFNNTSWVELSAVTEPSFNIDTNDFKQAISNNYYSLIS